MTAPRHRISALLLAAGLLIALIAAATMISAETVGRGWLCAFVFVAMVPIGSLSLLLVHGISGGRWGRDLAPVLIPAARAMPLLLVLFIPILVGRSAIFEWQHLALPDDVRQYYLNPLLFDARTLLALVIWSALAWLGAWRRQLTSALGLVAHGVLNSVIPADWVLTLPPGSNSAGFGFGFGIEQMAAALAVAAIMMPCGNDPRANQDLAGLIVTTLLGTVYFVFMQYIVIWYGNVPQKVHWYAVRATGWWPEVAFAAFMVGAALPFLAILNPAVRREASALRVVGIMVLGGALLHVVWLIAPAFGAAALVPAAVAAPAMALALFASARPFNAPGVVAR